MATASGIQLAPGVTLRDAALHWHFACSGGPGGQNVNKVATKAELRLRIEDIQGWPSDARERLRVIAAARFTDAGDLLIVAQNRRTQEGNRAACLTKLKDWVALALVRPKPRKRTKPSWGARQSRLDAKRKNSTQKQERNWRDE